MNLKLAVAWACVAVVSANAQSDSVSKTLLTRRDAEIGAAALATAAAISWFASRASASANSMFD